MPIYRLVNGRGGLTPGKDFFLPGAGTPPPTTTPTDPTPVTPPPTDPDVTPSPDNAWTISGTSILGADGTPVVLNGTNIGVNASIGGAIYPDDESKTPHITEAQQWNWNVVRINMYVTEEVSWVKSYTREKCITDTWRAADKYLAAGFVVIIAPMDITAGVMPRSESKLLQIEDFFTRTAARYKDERRLWLNINEPVGVNTATQFQDFHSRFYNAVRATGNTSIFLADIMTNAQDANWGSSPKVHDPSVGPAFLQGKTNVAFGLHVYGGQIQNTTGQSNATNTYTNYLTACKTAGLAMLVGETGYRVDGKDQAGGTADVNRNVRGYRAILAAAKTHKVGVLTWHGTFDLFSHKNTLRSTYHGRPFWYQGASGDLSPMGQEFWTHCH